MRNCKFCETEKTNKEMQRPFRNICKICWGKLVALAEKFNEEVEDELEVEE